MRRVEIPTEFGAFRALLSERGVHRQSFPGRSATSAPPADGGPLAARLTAQLQAYFRGELTEFTVPLDLDQGNDFQRAVWAQLLTIPTAR